MKSELQVIAGIHSQKQSSLSNKGIAKMLQLPIYVIISSCAIASGDPERIDYTTVLSTHYPEYNVIGPSFETELYRTSPELVVNDFLVGDFNNDSVNDIAAILSRQRSLEEAAADPNIHTREYLRVDIAVVCNGQTDDPEDAEDFECFRLTDEKHGELGQELGFLGWNTGGNVLGNRIQSSDCQTKQNERRGPRTLALLQEYGRCDSYYFPIEAGGYGSCTYCAD